MNWLNLYFRAGLKLNLGGKKEDPKGNRGIERLISIPPNVLTRKPINWVATSMCVRRISYRAWPRGQSPNVRHNSSRMINGKEVPYVEWEKWERSHRARGNQCLTGLCSFLSSVFFFELRPSAFLSYVLSSFPNSFFITGVSNRYNPRKPRLILYLETVISKTKGKGKREGLPFDPICKPAALHYEIDSGCTTLWDWFGFIRIKSRTFHDGYSLHQTYGSI